MNEDTPTKPRLPRPRGYFTLWREDLFRICELGEQDDIDVSVPILISVWCALSAISNENKLETFDVSVGVIRKRAGISRRSAFAALRVLESRLKMIQRHQNSNGPKSLEPNTWTIFPSKMKPSASGAQRIQRTTPSAAKEDHNLHRGLNNSPSGNINKDKEASSPAAGQPEASLSRIRWEW